MTSTPRGRFMERLSSGEILLFDGAMGTMLYDKGIFLNRCFDEINLTGPELVSGIHREYLKAGADVLTTNTFGATAPRLAKYGFEGSLPQINRQGVALARQAIRDAGREGQAFVAGSIGPLGLRLEPLGALSREEAKGFFRQQAEALLAEPVDLFILETFVDLEELHQACLAVRECSGLPVVASLTIKNDGNSIYGSEPHAYTALVDGWGVEVIGLNCSNGPRVMLEAAEKMVRATDKPICIQPNAGVPSNVNGRNFYLCTPKYMAEYARRFIQTGVHILGGCCGTTPEHIREMRRMIQSVVPHKVLRGKIEVSENTIEVTPIPMEEKSDWGRKLKTGQFVTSVELLPPRGPDMSRLIRCARELRDRRIDAVNVPDGPRASSRMSALATSVMLRNTTNTDVILHYTCRDKNLLGIQSDLIGAYALGIRNLLLITGDPPSMGGYPDATAVFDVDSIGLCNIVQLLNRGYDLGKNFMGQPLGFCYGVGVNPCAVNLDYEIRHFWWKIDAGAEYAISQTVFDADSLFRFLDRIGDFPKIPLIAGIWPLASYRNAEFMKYEVPGVCVPDSVMARMEKCATREEAQEEGVCLARELLDKLRGVVSGVQVAAPFGNIQLALRVLGIE